MKFFQMNRLGHFMKRWGCNMYVRTEHIIDLLRDLGVKNKITNRDIVSRWLVQHENDKVTTTPEPTVAELNRRYPQLSLFKREGHS